MSELGTWSTCETVAKAFPAGVTAVKNSTVIVTGASAGIGEETAFQLAVLGAYVVCAVRNVQKGEEAVAKMRQRAGDIVLKISVLQLDTADLSTIPTFLSAFAAESARARMPPLKYLINNAGIAGYPEGKNTSKQGHDLIFDTNHLGHFALTNGLLPVLRQNAPSRIIIVASDSHYMPAVTQTSFSDMGALNEAVVVPKLPAAMGFKSTTAAYGDSKLLNVLHAQELHVREKKHGVTTSVLHPGNMITTSIADTSGTLVRFLFKYVIAIATKNVNQGAANTLYCTLANTVDVEGRYFANCAPKRPSKLATPAAGGVMWQLSDLLAAKTFVSDTTAPAIKAKL